MTLTGGAKKILGMGLEKCFFMTFVKNIIKSFGSKREELAIKFEPRYRDF